MKKSFANLANGVLQNVIANIMVLVLVPTLGIVYALSTSNPQLTLLAVLLVAVAINIFIAVLTLRQQRILREAFNQHLFQTQKELASIKQWVPMLDDPAKDPIAEQADDEFEITDKRFDSSSSPQKLIIQFTNRGRNLIYVKRVKYSGNSLGIPTAAILSSYIKESGDYVIPFDVERGNIGSGGDFIIEICLAQTWRREDVDKAAGKWGYLRIEIQFLNKTVELFNSI